MKARFIWTAVASMIVMSGLVPFNFYMATTFTSPAAKVLAGYYTLIIIEAMIVFLTSFTIVNQYFTLHPPALHQIIEEHKQDNPEIPERYYEDPKKRAEELREDDQKKRIENQTIVPSEPADPRPQAKEPEKESVSSG